MKYKTLTYTAFAAATVFSVGVLAGCEYCQPLLLASVAYLVIKRRLPSAGRNTLNETFAS